MMKLSMKIGLGYIVVGIFVLLCTGVGLYGLQNVQQALGASDTRAVDAIRQAKMLCAVVGAGGLGLAIVAALVLSRAVAASTQKMTDLAQTLVSGTLPTPQEISGQDEYSAVLRAASTMAANFRQSLHELTSHATALQSIASEVSTVSRQLVTHASTTRDTATTTTAAVQKMLANMCPAEGQLQTVQTDINAVTILAEQMTATIDAMAHNTSAALQEVADAVQGVATASGHLSDLDSTVAELSKLPEAMLDIAAQTQCLAMNAALAIARTGESTVPGFTTVATDLEELATQAQAIMEYVRQQITELQQRVAGAVEDMQQISAVMHDADVHVESLASTVETQSATTHTVAQHVTKMATELQDTKGIVRHAAEVSQAISTNMATVDALSAELDAAGSQMTARASTLSKVSQALQELTSKLA